MNTITIEKQAKCKGCGNTSWLIFVSYIQCEKCKKQYKTPPDVKACDIVNLTNDNY